MISLKMVFLLATLAVACVFAAPQTKIHSRVRIHVPVYRHTRYITLVKAVPVRVPVPVRIAAVKLPPEDKSHWQSDYEEDHP